MLLTGIWQMQYVRKAVAYETQKVASRSMDRAVQVIDNRISNIDCPARIAPNATATLTGTITAQTKDLDKVFIITLITNSPQRPIVTLFVSGVIQ